MSSSANILLEVATLSMRLSRKLLDLYSQPKSPHRFTQAQSMTCLVLKTYLKTTYRGLIDVLGASENLQTRLGLKRLPHYSTLKYFAEQANTLGIVDAMLAEIVMQIAPDEETVAVDSTGVKTASSSAYFRTQPVPL